MNELMKLKKLDEVMMDYEEEEEGMLMSDDFFLFLMITKKEKLTRITRHAYLYERSFSSITLPQSLAFAIS